MRANRTIGPFSKAVTITACVLAAAATGVGATEPCGDFGACKVLVEINASDGDIGFHFLLDGDELRMARIEDPNGAKVFEDRAHGALAEQTLTETFAESAEPLCWADPEADPDEDIVTLDEFLDRWTPGTYAISGKSAGGEKSVGETELTFALPAAPGNVDFDGSAILWSAGDDLGRCATAGELDALVGDGVLPVHPQDVVVRSWEVVLEPDVEPDHPADGLKFTIRVAGDVSPTMVTVPADYLASLPDDTPAKVEVGAIGVDDNATFTEAGDFCINVVDGCDD